MNVQWQIYSNIHIISDSFDLPVVYRIGLENKVYEAVKLDHKDMFHHHLVQQSSKVTQL